ncbi:DUF937 domain-containing protein [Tellurirhabdus rosea]|uniref:DUF937 domain-containing protein n=1 Tax=Tellurirhabdus rosea TaxID=2674997 RepID=UPI00224DB9F5|nr:DUF937 domain-containing protein [Tellurirhabdus rosea]
MNLVAVLKENLTDTVVSRAAYYVDENPEKTRTALEGIVCTIVAGLMKRTTTEIGVNQLFNAIQKGKYDGSLVASFPDLLKDPEQVSRLAEAGSNSISHLLPAMKSSMGTMISSYANIKNSAAITLLGLMTPVALGTLHQLVLEKKMDADALASLLADQRDRIVENTPERLLDKMGEGLNIQQLLALGVTPAKRSATIERPVLQERPRFVPEPDEDSNGSLAKWGIGALVLVALAGGGYYIWNNTQNYSDYEETAISTDYKDSTATDSTKRLTATPVSGSATAPVSATPAAAGTATAELAAYLASPEPAGRAFKQPFLAFEKGSLTPAATTQPAITELANLLKANPRLQIQLIGYANDATLPMTNKVLSTKRVYVLKQQLIDAGVDLMRIDAVGFGTGVRYNPADTSASRKPTRREVLVKVVTK